VRFELYGLWHNAPSYTRTWYELLVLAEMLEC
jgi:hypothetical protein